MKPAQEIEQRPLSQLRRGQNGSVVADKLSDEDAAMLRAMGLSPSARVQLCRPGEPCIVRVTGGCGSGCRIGLSKQLAQRVIVRVGD